MGQRDVKRGDEASLAERLRARIRREGAISFYDWMRAALYDASEGYYCRRDMKRWGREGDYRTSPERSPLFAATFARYFTTLYEELGSPKVFQIIEAGAGAGHFAEGVLDTLQRRAPHIFAATRYLIDEASAEAREHTRLRLARFKEHVEFGRLSEMESPVRDCVIFANELLDAFPVHRVRMRHGRLSELCVGLDEHNAFRWVEGEPGTPRLASYFERIGVRLPEGRIAEVNLEAADWIEKAASLLKRGYLITVDYGAQAVELYQTSHRPEGTLRAFRSHQFMDDPLVRPGEQDLTTTVDWTHILRAGEGAGLSPVSFERQDEFLLRTGILDMMEMMVAEMDSDAEAIRLRSGARELILPGGISHSFQVLIQKRSGD